MALISRMSYFFRPTHDRIVTSIEAVLRQQNWQVEREPAADAIPADIVAREPNGATYVIEVKRGAAEANLGAIAEVETLRDVVAKKTGEDAKGVLVIAGEVPDELDAAAANAGVTLVRAGSGTSGSVLESLTRSGVVNDYTGATPGAAVG